MPLPQWSVQGHNVIPKKKVTYLENFPAYIRNTAANDYHELLNELNQNFYKPQGKPPYASVIQYALHLRYTSLQA